MAMEQMLERMTAIWLDATEIWLSGGWGMIGIAIVAMVMFGLGVNIHWRLQSKAFGRVSEKTWRRWLDHPEERKGSVGWMLDFVSGARSLKDITVFFEELRSQEIKPFVRDLRVMRICVSAAPLLGLLGTVTGMLSTFGALASGSGADQTMDMVAGGISEALITTETGLIIAIPGLFFQYQLGRKFDRYRAFLAHLETVCTQRLHRQLRSKQAA